MAHKIDYQAIDMMNYPFTPERQKRAWETDTDEFKIMARTIFKREPQPAKGWTPAQFVARMDAAGYEKVFIPALKMFSNRYKKPIGGWWYSVEEIHEMIKDYPNRLIGLCGYNPLRIKESLEELDRGVKLGFKGVYVHTYGYGLRVNDRKMYPLYARCEELGIPVSMQTGHSLETMPSDPGRPIYLDDIALDFPKLKLVASHTGWPWCEELIAMAWKHENVYADVAAHRPRYLEASFVQNMDSRMRDKVLYGTNGDLERLSEFLELPLKPESFRAILRDNTIRVYKL